MIPIEDYERTIAVNSEPVFTDGEPIGHTVDCDTCKYCIGVVPARFTLDDLIKVAANHAWIHGGVKL